MFESKHIVSNPSRLCCDSSVTDLKISFQHHLHLFFVIVTYVCFSSHFYWPLTFTLDDLWGTENTIDTTEYYLCTRLSVFGRMLYSAFWTPCCKFKHNENNGCSFSDGLPYGKILYLADLICPAPSQGERAHPGINITEGPLINQRERQAWNQLGHVMRRKWALGWRRDVAQRERSWGDAFEETSGTWGEVRN